MTERTQKRAFLVTGAACGIGRAIVERLVSGGGRVILTDRDERTGREAARQIDEGRDLVRFLPLDVTDEDQWNLVINDILLHEGALHGLVNNAGLVRYGTLADTKSSDWTLLKQVMLDGMFLGVRAAAPVIERSGGGSIVNVASIHAFYGAADQIAYAAVKAAARMFSRSAALEWAGRGVRINALLPGPTLTAIIDNLPDAEREAIGPMDAFEERFRAAVPLGRLGTPDNIAGCATFLLSEDAGFLVGSDLVADGGVVA
jgi:NAD(P)-dependent dehydrogenase (short-subunit alcohol dehydrogenase family)